MRTPRRTSVVTVVALVVAVVLAASGFTPASAQPASPGNQAETVDVAAVARKLGRSEAVVRRMLANPTFKVTKDHKIYHADPPAAAAASGGSGATAAAPAPFPYARTFLLHSRPGSQRTIYLDFDGHVIDGEWLGLNGMPGERFLASEYSLDASPSFSTAEQDVIQSVWQRIAEDFAPFDVDVTTEEPSADRLTRTNSNDAVFGMRTLITNWGEAGVSPSGVAFVGTFNEIGTPVPALVYSGRSSDPKILADVAVHETGHTLSLQHDGNGGNEYYGGHGAWAPHMGFGHLGAISQWSKGEYPNASTREDDLALISAYGLPPVTDDVGDTPAAAAPLVSRPGVDVSGTIGTDADVDVFRIDADAGPASFQADPAPVSPDLDIRLELLDSAGALVASADPLSARVSADVASGLSASVSATLEAGTYYLSVTGTGAGTLSTGYSGYASLGRYRLSGSVTTATSMLSVSDAPPTLEDVGGAATATFAVTLSAPATSTVSVDVSTSDGTATAESDFVAVSGTVEFPPGTTSVPFPVAIAGDGVPEPDETFQLALTNPSGAAVAASQATGTILNDDATPPANDDFSSATTITGEYGTAAANNVGASAELLEPDHAGVPGGRSIWFAWTAPFTGQVNFDTVGSGIDTVLAVYTGLGPAALVPLAGNDNNGASPQSSVRLLVVAGLQYRIAVDGRAGATHRVVRLTWFRPTANDDLANAAALSSTATGTVSSSNLQATHEVGEPSHAGQAGARSVWFSWTAPSTVRVAFTTSGSAFDTLLAVYTGTSVATLTPVASNDNYAGPQSRLAFQATSGTTYRIAVDGRDNGAGAIALRWAPPPVNDLFATSTVLVGSTGSAAGSNLDADKEPGEPNHAGSGGASVWFNWSAPTTGRYTFDTYGSSFNTLLGVYTGSTIGALAVVASNDNNSSASTYSKVTFDATAGTTYRIAVDGVSASSGPLTLTWAVAPANDAFASATSLSGTAGLATGSNVGASRETGEPGFASNLSARTVWYRWKMPTDGTVEIKTVNSSFNATMTVYTGTVLTALTYVTFGSSLTLPVTKDAEYRFVVDGYSGQRGQVQLDYKLRPANDDFDAPIVVSGVSGSATGSNLQASKEPGEPSHAGSAGGRSIWYSWTSPTTARVAFDTKGSTYDTLLAVYTGNAVNSLTQVVSNNDAPTPSTSKLAFNAVAGTTYRIAVDGVTAGGSTTLRWGPTPSNDAFASAVTLPMPYIPVAGNNSYATKEAGEPVHAGNTGGSSVWYRVSNTALFPTSIRIDTFGSTFDTLLGVYTGVGPGGLVQVAANDDAGGTLQSEATFLALPFTTYYVAVDGYRDATGQLSVRWIK